MATDWQAQPVECDCKQWSDKIAYRARTEAASAQVVTHQQKRKTLTAFLCHLALLAAHLNLSCPFPGVDKNTAADR